MSVTLTNCCNKELTRKKVGGSKESPRWQLTDVRTEHVSVLHVMLVFFAHKRQENFEHCHKNLTKGSSNTVRGSTKMYIKFLVYDMPTVLPVLKQKKIYTVSSQLPKCVKKKITPWPKETVWRKKCIINVVYHLKHQIMKKISYAIYTVDE
jgi:hypothetical protein